MGCFGYGVVSCFLFVERLRKGAIKREHRRTGERFTRTRAEGDRRFRWEEQEVQDWRSQA